MKSIHIIGGGLAGLSLGIALRRAGVPVSITEATRYPRHRVCGEFISGAGRQTLESFGLASILAEAVPNLETAWFSGNRILFAKPLPAPALGLSRFQLDRRLADAFRELGGQLATGVAAREFPADPGTVLARGRRGTSRDWIALKLHCRNFEPKHDLTMHLGARGYTGVSRIEDGKVNVCGLFRARRGLSPGKAGVLIAYLQANGLTDLAEQVSAAEVDPASISATTALDFKTQRWPSETVCIGDCNTAIPPFAGNGISMSFESAQTALPHLLSYARGDRPWPVVRKAVRADLGKRFRLRLATARFLHPFLLRPGGRRPLNWAASTQLLPFNLLYRLLR